MRGRESDEGIESKESHSRSKVKAQYIILPLWVKNPRHHHAS
jgi:hypothetical protein